MRQLAGIGSEQYQRPRLRFAPAAGQTVNPSFGFVEQTINSPYVFAHAMPHGRGARGSHRR